MVAPRPLKQPRLPKHLLLWLLLQLAASVGDLGSLPTLARCALISADGHVADLVPCYGARYGSSTPRLGRQVLVPQHVGRSPTACDASALGQLAKPCGCLVAVRGGCSFAQKAQVAETAGCQALLIVDTSTVEHQDQAEHPDFGTAGITIPAAMVTREVGRALLEMAGAGSPRQVELVLSAARATPAASSDSEEDRDRGVAWETCDSAGAAPIAAVVARRVTATLVAYHVAAAPRSAAAPTDYGDDMTTVYVRAVASAASEGTGTRVWESSMALASWVVARAEQFRGKTVLELGCGLSGLPGFLASKFCRQITWTDGDDAVVAHVQSQLAINRKVVRSSTAVVQVLGWGTGGCAEPGGCRTYDVVLGSDLLYSAAQVPLLAKTLEQRVAPGGLALVVMPLARSETHFLAELSRLLLQGTARWRVSLRELVLSKQDFRFGGARNKSDVSAQWDFAAWHHACNTPHQAACPRAQTLPVSLLEAQKL